MPKSIVWVLFNNIREREKEEKEAEKRWGTERKTVIQGTYNKFKKIVIRCLIKCVKNR